ncbi:hypothetical protein CN373_19270 [Bacillus cereus]|uniref:hypothetical protein n=1 Tax=Bacillus cereus TaxID=1396 RepID=UPI000BF7B3F3|nr:hypothetical protein [Bacillus cereus]PFA18431.1 hypothetical protein CN373_19270 [Bacillus cereus]
MSTIVGIYHVNQDPITVEHCNGMMRSLKQYPADDIGTWKKKDIFLGCHTQWITTELIGE